MPDIAIIHGTLTTRGEGEEKGGGERMRVRTEGRGEERMRGRGCGEQGRSEIWVSVRNMERYELN